jgi:hypothetical protein
MIMCLQDGLNVTGTVQHVTLNVSGLSTFAGITTVTGETLFSKQLNVSGLSTLPTLSGTTVTYTTGNFTTGNIVTGIVTTLTSTNATLTNINSSGITTLGVTSTTNLTAQQLNASVVYQPLLVLPLILHHSLELKHPLLVSLLQHHLLVQVQVSQEMQEI